MGDNQSKPEVIEGLKPDELEGEGTVSLGSDEVNDEEAELVTPDDTKAREKNIVSTLPSRQIGKWRSIVKRSKKMKQRMDRGGVYMPINRQQDDNESDDDVMLDIGETPSNKYVFQEPLCKRIHDVRVRRASSVTEKRTLSCCRAIQFRIAMGWENFKYRASEFFHSFEIWRGHLKEIEGNFGNGVLSYFTFLKWLLFLNLYTFFLMFCFVITPQAVYDGQPPVQTPNIVNRTNGTDEVLQHQFFTTLQPVQPTMAPAPQDTGQRNCHLVKPDTEYKNVSVAQFIGNFMQGVGWINTTLMFYGSYTNETIVIRHVNTSPYDMPLAYFLVGCTYMLISLLMILSSASSIFEEGYIKEGSKFYNTYSNKVFGGWDMCIMDCHAAKLKAMSIRQEVEASIAEDIRRENAAKRTRKQKCKLYALRIFLNLFILALSALAGYAIFAATDLSLKTSQKTSTSNKKEILILLKSYASPFTLSALNIILPNFFFFLSQFEDWNPRDKINIDLARTVLLKLASVGVLMVSLYNKIQSQCMLCWENAIGAEMYKLIWTDFLIVIVLIILVETPRRYVADKVTKFNLGQKIGRPTFNIPQHVLGLVYGQSLIWIGAFFSPFIPLMGVIKLVVFFYAKKLSLMHNHGYQEKAYRAGRSNYFFMFLLLVTFCMCLAALSYGVTQVYPSKLYGPFRTFKRMYEIIPETVENFPSGLKGITKIFGSTVFMVVLIFVICLGLYFFYATSKAYKRMIEKLKAELSVETQDKKYLLRQLTTESAATKTLK